MLSLLDVAVCSQVSAGRAVIEEIVTSEETLCARVVSS